MRSTQAQPRRVLAFDPGYERLGVAVVEREHSKERLVFSDCVRTSASLPFEDRLAELGRAAERYIEEYQPHEVALEEVFFAKNEKTAVKIAEVRGVLTFVARKAGIVVRQFTPLEVKVAVTGYGKSEKSAVLLMVQRLVKMPQKKRLDDEIDAIAIGLTCLATGTLRPTI